MEQEVQYGYEKYYLVASKQTPKGKITAEYDTKNNSLRLFIYKGDVVANAYFDDDNDGRVETLFLNGERTIRRKRTWGEFLRHPFARDENKRLFREADKRLNYLKQNLDLDDLIDGHPGNK